MISAFYTTLKEAENSPKTSLLSTIKPSICTLGHKPAYKSPNHAIIPLSYTLIYNINTFYLKEIFQKCI